MSEQRPSFEPAEPEPEAEELIGAVLAGRYRIEELLGVGGMGSVYRATDLAEQRPMAIKVLHREMTSIEEVVARFQREAVAAQRIAHPHVVAATDFGPLENGSYYLALEFVAGERLSVEIAHRPFAPGRALHVTRQVALALDAAHRAGVVHRDLKPDNIMLVRDEAGGDFVKVLDFGIAKLSVEDTKSAPQLTRVGAVFGTPEYMAPEQARGVPVDLRADLYALGIILYEMLVGRPPFQDDDVTAVLQAQLSEAPRPLPPRVPQSIQSIVSELLAKRPEERMASAEALMSRIDAALVRDPALAGPAPPGRVARTLVDGPDGEGVAAGTHDGWAPPPEAEASLAPTLFLQRGQPHATANGAVQPAAVTPTTPAPEPARARAVDLAPTLLNVRRAGANAGSAYASPGGPRRAGGFWQREWVLGPHRVPLWLAAAMVLGTVATTASALAMLAFAGLFG